MPKFLENREERAHIIDPVVSNDMNEGLVTAMVRADIAPISSTPVSLDRHPCKDCPIATLADKELGSYKEYVKTACWSSWKGSQYADRQASLRPILNRKETAATDFDTDRLLCGGYDESVVEHVLPNPIHTANAQTFFGKIKNTVTGVPATVTLQVRETTCMNSSADKVVNAGLTGERPFQDYPVQRRGLARGF